MNCLNDVGFEEIKKNEIEVIFIFFKEESINTCFAYPFLS